MRVPHCLLSESMLGVVTVALLVVGGAALADPGRMGFHHGDDFLHGVALSDTQKEQVRQIEQGGFAQARGVFDQMRGVHGQIMSRLLSPGSVSEADLAPLVQQEETLRAQLDQQRLAQALQMRAVLSPQQLAEAASRHEQLEGLRAQEHRLMAPDAD